MLPSTALPNFLESPSLQVCIIQEFLLFLSIVSPKIRFLVRDLIDSFSSFPVPITNPGLVPSQVPRHDQTSSLDPSQVPRRATDPSFTSGLVSISSLLPSNQAFQVYNQTDLYV